METNTEETVEDILILGEEENTEGSNVNSTTNQIVTEATAESQTKQASAEISAEEEEQQDYLLLEEKEVQKATKTQPSVHFFGEFTVEASISDEEENLNNTTEKQIKTSIDEEEDEKQSSTSSNAAAAETADSPSVTAVTEEYEKLSIVTPPKSANAGSDSNTVTPSLSGPTPHQQLFPEQKQDGNTSVMPSVASSPSASQEQSTTISPQKPFIISEEHFSGASVETKKVAASPTSNEVTPTLSSPPAPGTKEKEVIPAFLRHMQEDVTQDYWKLHSKHIFILSDAAKPIFTRYGNEEDLNTMMGFFLTIASFLTNQKDNIRTIIAGNIKMVFVIKGCLYLVVVSRTSEPASELALQLEYLYAQIIFILTEKIQEILKKRSSFDLRKLLGGTDNILHSLIHVMSGGMALSLKAFRCLKLPKVIRNQIGDILVKFKTSRPVYAILNIGKRIVHIAKSKGYTMKVEDLLLLVNFVNSSSSMKSHETWTPVCLPSISPQGYFYAYIDYIVTDLSLIIICPHQDHFYECSKAKRMIVDSFIQQSLIESILSATKSPGFSVAEVKTIPELRHFVYKNSTLSQFCSSQYSPPYNSFKERKRLARVYKNVREILRSSKALNKIYFHTTNKETILAWISSSCELYACFSLTVSKVHAINAIEAIKKWIKKEEDSIFIPVFKNF